MPPRPPLPSDDLYARLGVPRDASSEAIDLAWRGLLRKHHPDVAGDGAVELAKRINIAHDWLSDPELRSRYDREHVDGIRVGRHPRAQGRADRPDTGWRAPRRPPTTAERVAAVIERVGRLTQDELDRLALAEPAPIAFLATLRRFVPPELDAVIDRAERAAMANLPPAARRDLATRDAVSGQLADIVLGDALEVILGDPAGPRARERLTRGWEAAVGQPRYGPATAAIGEMLERLRALSPGRRAVAGRERHPGAARGPVPGRGRRRRTRTTRCACPACWRANAAAAAVDAMPGSASDGRPRAACGGPSGAPARAPARFPVRDVRPRMRRRGCGGSPAPHLGSPRRPATRGGLSGREAGARLTGGPRSVRCSRHGAGDRRQSGHWAWLVASSSGAISRQVRGEPARPEPIRWARSAACDQSARLEDELGRIGRAGDLLISRRRAWSGGSGLPSSPAQRGGPHVSRRAPGTLIGRTMIEAFLDAASSRWPRAIDQGTARASWPGRCRRRRP